MVGDPSGVSGFREGGEGRGIGWRSARIQVDFDDWGGGKEIRGGGDEFVICEFVKGRSREGDFVGGQGDGILGWGRRA